MPDAVTSPSLPVLLKADGEADTAFTQRCARTCKEAGDECVALVQETSCAGTNGIGACCRFFSAPIGSDCEGLAADKRTCTTFFALGREGGSTTVIKREAAIGGSPSANYLEVTWDDDDEEEEEEEAAEAGEAQDEEKQQEEDTSAEKGTSADDAADRLDDEPTDMVNIEAPQPSLVHILTVALAAAVLGALGGVALTLGALRCLAHRKLQKGLKGSSRPSVDPMPGTVVVVPSAADVEAACEKRATSFDKTNGRHANAI